MTTAGIDGCKAGWFVVVWNHSQPFFYLVKTTWELVEIIQQCDRVLIDIPIGISSTTASRECDRLLRKNMGTAYGSSVFNPPVRQALYVGSYKKACDINEQITGKRLSKQSWNISNKIREIDQMLFVERGIRSKIYESHPEWCFILLNDGKVLPHKKKTEEGKSLRLKVLEKVWKNPDRFYEKVLNQFKRNELAGDDILDAMVLSCFATNSLKNGLYSFPEDPPKDKMGLKMGIFYTSYYDLSKT